MTGDRDDDSDGPAWHERTSTVVGASVAGLIVIGILFLGASCVARQFNEPGPVQPYYIAPTASSSSGFSPSTTTTTTETITSTSPPATTDINSGDTSTTSSSDTSGSSTEPTQSRHSHTPDEGEPSSTRRPPRFNETRTLNPRP